MTKQDDQGDHDVEDDTSEHEGSVVKSHKDDSESCP